ncbi:MAG: hypothetical protein KF835_15800 [Xanthobacteraceae bacterium]|nr:hypothetical protein [Xanthobacteraceae bacterium]
MIGAPTSCCIQLRGAITEPVNVIAPIAAPSAISTSEPFAIRTTAPMRKPKARRARRLRPAQPQRPPAKWNAATSYGICVIAILRAITANRAADGKAADHQRPADGIRQRRP